jgi:uncharacterized protein (TIGR03083 family)
VTVRVEKREEAAVGEKAQVVLLLGQEWREIAGLLAELDDDAWGLPALPGWDVHDVVAHLIGTELMLSGSPLPDAPGDLEARSHVRNDGAVTAQRLAALEAMSDEEFEAPSWTPAGRATYARFMRIRIFDSWMHEQDIRAAVGRPGNEKGPVAEESLAEVVQALGFIVGKRARAPEGSLVTLALTGPIGRELHVKVEGRATVVDQLPGPPTVTVSLPSTLFLRLAGGRLDPESVAEQIAVEGDQELGRRLAANLAYTI